MTNKETYNSLCTLALSSHYTPYIHVYDMIDEDDVSTWFFFAEPKCYFNKFATVYHLPEDHEKAWEHIQKMEMKGEIINGYENS